jgi:hemolysin D
LSQLDVARLDTLHQHFADLGSIHYFIVPDGASDLDAIRTRSALLAQAGEQWSKMAAIQQQIEQKRAEAESTAAAIAKIDATMPMVQETADVRRKAMEIQYGNRIAFLDAQTRLVDLQGERTLQERKLVEIEAARRALAEQVDQTKSGFERQALIDLSDARKKVEEFSQDLVKAERKYEEQALRSPIDGTIQQLAVHTVGGVVTPAQQLMMIVPIDSRLEAEAMISNRDIGFINAGQDAEIKIDTFNFTRYGLLRGKVASVSQDAIVKDKPNDKTGASKTDGALSESSEPDGQQLVYSTRVSFDQTEMQIDDRTVNLAPGMAVTVEIKTGTRRIIEYLMSPLLRYKHESIRER